MPTYPPNILPRKRSILLQSGTVGSDAINAVATTKISTQDAGQIELWVRVKAAGDLTGISVRPFVTAVEHPEAFTGVQNRDWTPLSSMALNNGVGAINPLDTQFQKSNWFATDGLGFMMKLPATGLYMAFALHEITGGTGSGTGSKVQVAAYLRQES